MNITKLRSLSARASGMDEQISRLHHREGPSGAYDIYNSIQDPTDSEANLVLDLVRAKRQVYLAQKTLADCIIRENEVLANLLRYQAEEAEKRLEDADVGLGCMRIAFKKNGWSHFPHPTQTRDGRLQTVLFVNSTVGCDFGGTVDSVAHCRGNMICVHSVEKFVIY
ncbi:hypothetical protein DFJ58DRAFT_838706 [Suillus subalutaceus]|uniref:uncharacterized protein n=1 Tax=Suillus subalutaceus TaxID=48586 RepID=UPI001B85C64B|nr:uncharacterized protein DFJ58DRAFT_838706 [Suillus subalutaceus]KAG1864963.1 hypothetical protein DFJ58DRAFT_838706 [Suillus subalutaceus]